MTAEQAQRLMTLIQHNLSLVQVVDANALGALAALDKLADSYISPPVPTITTTGDPDTDGVVDDNPDASEMVNICVWYDPWRTSSTINTVQIVTGWCRHEAQYFVNEYYISGNRGCWMDPVKTIPIGESNKYRDLVLYGNNTTRIEFTDVT